MLRVVEKSVSTGIVAGRSNEARRKSERFNADATKLVSEINQNEPSLKSASADLVVAGLQAATGWQAARVKMHGVASDLERQRYQPGHATNP